MSHRAISTPDAPAAVGPYSQAVVSAGMVYTSGQIPLDPATGELVTAGIEAATHQVLRNLRAVLEAAGSGLAQVVKTTIYVTDLRHFSAVNAVYASYFGDPLPARSTVQVAALPLGAALEIEATAALGSAPSGVDAAVETGNADATTLER